MSKLGNTLDETLNVIQKIKEIRSTIRGAKEESEYATEPEYPVEETDPDQAAVIATSMLKNVDKSLYRAMKLIDEGTLPWGTNENLGIPDGVGLAYNKFYDEYTPQEVKDIIAEKEAAVIAGDIVIETVF